MVGNVTHQDLSLPPLIQQQQQPCNHRYQWFRSILKNSSVNHTYWGILQCGAKSLISMMAYFSFSIEGVFTWVKICSQKSSQLDHPFILRIIYVFLFNGPAKSFFQRWVAPVWIGHEHTVYSIQQSQIILLKFYLIEIASNSVVEKQSKKLGRFVQNFKTVVSRKRLV